MRRLADRVGILAEYTDHRRRKRPTSDATRLAILRTLGIDASTPRGARAALDALDARERSRLLAPVRVVPRHSLEAAAAKLRLPNAWRGGGTVEWSVELAEESGATRRVTGVSAGGGCAGPRGASTGAPGEYASTRSASAGVGSESIRVDLGRAPPYGYHVLRARAIAGGEERASEQSLIIVPERCPGVRELVGRDRVFGITANLYTLRSHRNWGIGDLTDLAALSEWAAETGGAFVGINPLHALRNRGSGVSPYSPVSRLFRNPIYLDIEAIPEMKLSDEPRRLIASPEVRARRDALRESDHVAYEEVWALKRSVLEPLHHAFRAAHGRGGTERGRAYQRFLEDHTESLEEFATFQALCEELRSDDWREWPERYRDRSSSEVASFRDTNPERIDFHRWLQFEIDRQLAEAAARAEAGGLAIGLYQDVAIGSAPGGADTWAYPDLFVHGVTIGAPPDEYAARGQNWGLPPLDPVALREDGYRYWTRLVRAALRPGGALRIDHAAGLFRQFWIPEGADASDGAYVRYPADALLGILVLEAQRHRALLVGEDLGTVPPEVPPALHRRGIISSRVLYFEREGERFRSFDAYEPRALVTANTHDLVPVAGFWSGRDIEIRREAGLIDGEKAERQWRTRARARRALLERLAEEGLLEEVDLLASGAASTRDPRHGPIVEGPGATGSGLVLAYPQLAGAVHAFLCRTPAAMVGLSLDDLVGETEPVNLPGAPPDRFRSWTRKLSVPLEELGEHAGVRAALRCDRGDRDDRGDTTASSRRPPAHG